ncbi:MAG TPA: NAD(P)-dependent oxidoreductase [Candidatus Acidoferrales bacterium]|nr:NAD(P)-dependent oxidoreductase [Candidatus Acidoferrales bacterium]
MSSEVVLVTGGIGFIGMHVIQELHGRGIKDVSIVDNLFKGKKEFMQEFKTAVDFFPLDINSPNLDDLFKAKRFSMVIHLAAIHSIPYCISNPVGVCDVNIKGTQSIIERCKKFNVARIFHASSGAVYKPSNHRHTEDDIAEPIEIYGVSKLANEYQVKLLSNATGARCVVGRIFNVVGGFETNEHLIPDLLNRMKHSCCIEVGALDPVRDYVHVKDVARAIVDSTLNSENRFDVLNIGSGEGYSVRQVIDILSQIVSKEVRFETTETLVRKIERPHLLADIRKIHSIFGWEPQYHLTDALKDAANYFEVI